MNVISLKDEKQYLVCQGCKEAKSDVRIRDDRYNQEINNISDATWVACDSCDKDNALDI